MFIQGWRYWVRLNSILLLISFTWVWSICALTLPVLRCVSSSTASRYRTFLLGTFSWVTVTTGWSSFLLDRIIAASTHTVWWCSCVWACFLLRCKSLLFLALFVLLLNYRFLNLIVQKRKQILSIIRHQFLPNKKTFSTIHSCFNICIRNNLLNKRVHNTCVSIQNTI